eukprot:3674550-Ditylum_brightwellii.AAC.1
MCAFVSPPFVPLVLVGQATYITVLKYQLVLMEFDFFFVGPVLAQAEACVVPNCTPSSDVVPAAIKDDNAPSCMKME